MSTWILSLIFNLLVFGTAGLAFLWRYRAAIGRPARRREFQYRLYALRDRTINLVIDGVMTEEDPRWTSLYQQMNNSARTLVVDRLSNGLTFVLGVLRRVEPPTAEELHGLEELPPQAREIYSDYVRTVLRICWEGSAALRWAVWLAE